MRKIVWLAVALFFVISNVLSSSVLAASSVPFYFTGNVSETTPISSVYDDCTEFGTGTQWVERECSHYSLLDLSGFDPERDRIELHAMVKERGKLASEIFTSKVKVTAGGILLLVASSDTRSENGEVVFQEYRWQDYKYSLWGTVTKVPHKPPRR